MNTIRGLPDLSMVAKFPSAVPLPLRFARTMQTENRTATWGAIFDWDGVIIDSSRHHEQSWERLADEEKRVLPEGHFRAGFGRKNEFIIPEILSWSSEADEVRRLSLRKEALYREVVAEWGLEALPGVREWLQRLHDAGVPCAIGSSTHRANIDLSLKLLGIAEYFQAIVTSEDVTKGKPDPQVFLTAASKIDRAPQRCVVFEDALVGIEAAKAGGMRVVAVATTHPLSELRHADQAVERLDELQPDTLAEGFGWGPE
jgi:HAD superfamily hydrolase (TIGR01509 family)